MCVRVCVCMDNNQALPHELLLIVFVYFNLAFVGRGRSETGRLWFVFFTTHHINISDSDPFYLSQLTSTSYGNGRHIF